MLEEKVYVSLSEWLDKPDNEEFDFESNIWGAKKTPEGKIIPGNFRCRQATVEDKEQARQMAKKGKDSFDNATFGCAIIAACVINPRPSSLDIQRMRTKSAKEMERLLTAIVGDFDNPK